MFLHSKQQKIPMGYRDTRAESPALVHQLTMHDPMIGPYISLTFYTLDIICILPLLGLFNDL